MTKEKKEKIVAKIKSEQALASAAEVLATTADKPKRKNAKAKDKKVKKAKTDKKVKKTTQKKTRKIKKVTKKRKTSFRQKAGLQRIINLLSIADSPRLSAMERQQLIEAAKQAIMEL